MEQANLGRDRRRFVRIVGLLGLTADGLPSIRITANIETSTRF